MTTKLQTENREPRIIEVTEIMEMLPHRYPFLLVDRVVDFEEGKWLRAVKNVSVNEPCFTGHFPNQPVFPGVLILEAMAQATGVLAIKSYGKLKENELYYFAAVDNARFKRPVVPGDQMIIEVTFVKERRGITAFTGKVYVDDTLVCEADLMCASK
ncbi:3-hydroxyacyl-ACP dehydratase FabZ [Glaesserella parasuis]|uniref:3-hydroxyacyl-ACP dehydratase FabZ n=1 Tax=Glaesserella parasuis TaxID=738 RepID=UPI0003AC46BB|nr:3-hydroxyacyl-ACP dehydratase FabZ [Glaesserella parasuis]ATW44390.1 3-hydroxyacyl-[acyl-carrier-protein] dehydratase FabZ [Glaesserella parasuis D74]EQA09435.1 beta-hydroxyacyl-(acyl-carrier-protein) dehydratase FabZ [Glaesserella parasuis D74]MDP0317397.1 3-hydroxyacyl-ACP dehydratase FabZ [Glaesserella parasuis]